MTTTNQSKPRSADVLLASNIINKDTFNKMVLIGQNLQKRNPYGSAIHRKGFNIVRQANIRFFGVDNLGDYETF